MDEFLKKVSDNVKRAAEKMEIWTQIGRKKIELKQIESKINNACKVLGKEVYDFFEEKGFTEIKKEEVSVELKNINSLLEDKNKILDKINLLKTDEVNQEKDEI